MKVGSVSLAEAREAARLAKSRRGHEVADLSVAAISSLRARFLGHFGAASAAATKKRGAAKRKPVKRASAKKASARSKR